MHSLISNSFVTFKPELDNQVLKEAFNNIPHDPYFDGGYRYRTKSRIEVLSPNSLKILDRKDLYQPSYINSYENYGGISRAYEDIPHWLIEDKNFIKLIYSWLNTIPKRVRTISAHQIRTTSDLGKTVPEGRHRDGYDYIGVYVVARHNITADCALTTVWCNETDAVLFDGYLEEGGLISFDDNLVTHYTGDIVANNKEENCYRDVIILTCPDEGIY